MRFNFLPVRKLVLPLLLKALSHDKNSSTIPWNEHEVCKAYLIPNKVRLASLVEVVLDDSKDASNLVGVAVDH